MVEYTKEWLSTDQQIERLREHGLEIAEDEPAEDVLEAIGYYRLTGYLYPFRQSETYRDENERPRIRVLSEFTRERLLLRPRRSSTLTGGSGCLFSMASNV